MKKKSTVVFIIISFASALLAVFIPHGTMVAQKYDSEPMLQLYYSEDGELSDKTRRFFDDTRIDLITISKGDELYSWFGHTGLMVSYPDRDAVIFDYGNFSFGPGFYADFAMGNLWYRCCCRYADDWINAMKAERRTVSAVELNLSAEKKKALCTFLYENAKEENCVYLYKIYTDNCATRIRDIIDRAVDGGLRSCTECVPGYTNRQNISRMLFNSRPVMWILDCLQSCTIDSDASLWEGMFLPGVLEKCVMEYPGLAASRRYLTDYREKTAGRVTLHYLSRIMSSLYCVACLLLLSFFFCPV